MVSQSEKNIFFDPTKQAHLGENVTIDKTVRIRNLEMVSIGDNSIIDNFYHISGNVTVGRYVHVGASCSIQAASLEILAR